MWKKIRNKKFALGLALLAASMDLAPNMTSAADGVAATQSERPAPPDWSGNGQPPAPPTDENGNPLPPPDGHGGGHAQNGRPAPPSGDGSGQTPTPPNGHGQPPQGMEGGVSGRGQDAKSADNLSASCMWDGKEEAVEGKTLSADAANESSVIARNGAKLTLRGATLRKLGDTTSEEDSNFTGQNAVLLANNSTVVLSDTTLSSAADGANAIFATGKQASITVRRVTIRTEGNSSRGLDATYGGTVTGEAVDIATKGAHCAALATDRGEGTVSVTDSRLITEGEGSPCIYSTGAIAATNTLAPLTAAKSR